MRVAALTLAAAIALSRSGSGLPLAQDAAAPEGAARAALLVGIGHYPRDAGLEDLPGAAGDVQRMKEVLTERFGFREEDCRTLIEDQATHAAIVQAFRDFLIQRSGPRTYAVFYFSGHGSRIPDESGLRTAEPDGFDSTFVAYDSRSGEADGAHDLTDDELRSLLSKLVERTPNVLVVTDACHSGGAVRGYLPKKAAPPGRKASNREWVLGFWPPDVPLADDSDEPLPGDRYLHIAACRRDEDAFEMKVKDGDEIVHRGVLTYFLARRLEQARPKDSWRLVIDDCKMQVATHVPQTVTNAGAADRGLFGGDFREAIGFRARLDRKEEEVIVEAGTLHGLRVGSQLEIRDPLGERKLGSIDVRQLDPLFARGPWRERPEQIPAGGLRAIERTRTAGMPPLRVQVTDQELAKALATSQRIEIAGKGELADYELVRSGEGKLSFRTNEGLPIGGTLPSIGEPGWKEKMEEIFQQELSWLSLRALPLERGALPVKIVLREPTAEDLRRPKDPAGYMRPKVLDAGSPREPRATDELVVVGGFKDAAPVPMAVLDLTNPHNVDLYVTVISLAEDRGREPICFLGRESNVPLPAGESTSLLTGIVIPREWPLKRPMRDRYVVIATRQPADFTMFRRESSMRGDEKPLPPLLRLAIEQADTMRGDSPVAVDTHGWGVSAVDLLVQRP